MFDETDTNGDGVVDREEYLYFARDWLDAVSEMKINREALYEYARALYDAADINGDGVLSRREMSFEQFLSNQDARLVREGKATPGPPDFGLAESLMVAPHLDENGDGRVDLNEFGVVCDAAMGQWLSNFYSGLTGGDIEAVKGGFLKEADVDGNGELTGREFQYAAFVLTDGVADLARRALLRDLDNNSDGKIDWQEVAACVEREHCGANAASFTHQRFSEYDADSDGALSGLELLALARGFMEMGPH